MRRWYPDEFRDAMLFWAIILATPILLVIFLYMMFR
jgi:hypothetical protein